jgi:hypothetical protein
VPVTTSQPDDIFGNPIGAPAGDLFPDLTTSRRWTEQPTESPQTLAAVPGFSPRSPCGDLHDRAEARPDRGIQVAQALVLAAVFAAPSLMAVHAAPVADPDVWWHLRTGEWIVQHLTVPRTDPFSRSAAGEAWAAYSWLFDLVLLPLYHRLGLAAIVAYTAAMVLAITFAVHHLIRRMQSDFSFVMLLTFAASFTLARLYTPRPWLFTILFFVIELDILMQARRTGRIREICWLPLLFLFWANLHIQFIDGLLVLGLAAAETVASRWGLGTHTRLRSGPMVAVLAVSALATLVNPYGWHIYQVARDLAGQPGVLDKISELKAIPFRDLADYFVLFFAVVAGGALAWRRTFPIFETLLLLFAAVVSFRSERDLWVVVTAGVAILASNLKGGTENEMILPRFSTAAIAVVAAVAIAVGFRAMHVNNASLQAGLSETMPVHAAEFAREQAYAGPLFNDFDWGGYLIWNLRLPVSIDGRAALHGDARIDRSIATWLAGPGWAADPSLTSAGLVIGPVRAPLVEALRKDPRFRLEFEDKVAAVFVARRPASSVVR